MCLLIRRLADVMIAISNHVRTTFSTADGAIVVDYRTLAISTVAAR